MRRIPGIWYTPIWLALAGSSLLSVGVVWGTRIPLGIPGEWEWSRVAPESGAGLLYAIVVAVLVAAGYMGFVRMGARRMPLASRWERRCWLVGLVAAGFGWLWVAQESAPPGFQLSRAPWVLYFRGTSGYFSEARYNPAPPGAFLAGYEQRMSEGDVLHIGTHPPGLIVVFRGLIELVHRWPGLADVLIPTQPASVREAFDVVAEHALRDQPLMREDRAVLWLAALLAMLLAAAAVLPIYGLLRFDHAPETSWLAASFWPILPGLAVFLPKSDALLPCFGAGFLLLWLSGCRRQSPGLSAVAGLLLWTGMLISLAMLPVVCLAMLLSLREVKFPQAEKGLHGISCRGMVLAVLGGAAGFLVPCLVLWLASDMNLFRVWAWNYANHAGFYAEFPRTYWKWLLVNPLELTFSAGAPLVLIALWSGTQSLRRGDGRKASLVLACAATWLLLWVSGKNMGEAGRLWLIVMPWLPLLSAPFFEQRAEGENAAGPASLANWGIGLACQFAVTVAVATRVVGFTVPGAEIPVVTTVITRPPPQASVPFE